MLVVFLPIFVMDTKFIYGYNFLAPLKLQGQRFESFQVIASDNLSY